MKLRVYADFMSHSMKICVFKKDFFRLVFVEGKSFPSRQDAIMPSFDLNRDRPFRDQNPRRKAERAEDTSPVGIEPEHLPLDERDFITLFAAFSLHRYRKKLNDMALEAALVAPSPSEAMPIASETHNFFSASQIFQRKNPHKYFLIPGVA